MLSGQKHITGSTLTGKPWHHLHINKTLRQGRETQLLHMRWRVTFTFCKQHKKWFCESTECISLSARKAKVHLLLVSKYNRPASISSTFIKRKAYIYVILTQGLHSPFTLRQSWFDFLNPSVVLTGVWVSVTDTTTSWLNSVYFRDSSSNAVALFYSTCGAHNDLMRMQHCCDSCHSLHFKNAIRLPEGSNCLCGVCRRKILKGSATTIDHLIPTILTSGAFTGQSWPELAGGVKPSYFDYVIPSWYMQFHHVCSNDGVTTAGVNCTLQKVLHSRDSVLNPTL